MKDILQQIQSLKEDFMNLIEVEGLGQPASDVPPSTNKIKKDKKTKNGKVELVSVEDELFPYDGNKREQYRQKILDTINGMIQGTATLEDLLQIVRQKKAPLKEATELLETINVKDHKKYHGGGATFSYKGNDYSYSPERGLRKEGKTKDDRNPVQKAVDSSNKEFDKARKYNYDLDRQSRNVGKKINKEVSKLEKKEGKGAFPGKTNDTIKKLIDTVNVIKANKADADKKFTEVNKRQQDMANDAGGVKHQMYDVWTSKKGDNFGFKPSVKTSEVVKIGEAIDLMEAIINEVSDKYVEGKRENYKIKRDKAVIRHAQTITDENPEGDPELLKDRQSKIDRLNRFDEKNKRYKELKREGKIKPYNKEESNG